MNKQQAEHYMLRAIELAKKGEGFVNPNPLVGAVIVKNEKIIGEGFHEQYGGPHAEINAFSSLKEDAKDATMFVTLEPCSHHGKTPPCALSIIKHKIKKVYVAKLDPNPLVSGKGIKILQDAGIEVEHGLFEDIVTKQNEIFFKYIQTNLPFVSLKYAMTLDGKIATSTNDSKWITNEKSRHFVHELRNQHMAILVGVNTIILDDARLDTRLPYPSRHPIRIVIDPHLRIPPNAYVLRTAKEQPTWIISTKTNQKIIKQGARIIKMKTIHFKKLMILLGKEQIDSVLIEGGAFTHAAALESEVVDKVYAFIAPKMIGGKEAPSPISGQGIPLMKDAIVLDNTKTTFFGEDILIEGYIHKGETS